MRHKIIEHLMYIYTSNTVGLCSNIILETCVLKIVRYMMCMLLHNCGWVGWVKARLNDLLAKASIIQN